MVTFRSQPVVVNILLRIIQTTVIHSVDLQFSLQTMRAGWVLFKAKKSHRDYNFSESKHCAAAVGRKYKFVYSWEMGRCCSLLAARCHIILLLDGLIVNPLTTS